MLVTTGDSRWGLRLGRGWLLRGLFVHSFACEGWRGCRRGGWEEEGGGGEEERGRGEE